MLPGEFVLSFHFSFFIFFKKKKKKKSKGNNGFSAVPNNVNDLGYFSLGIFYYFDILQKF